MFASHFKIPLESVDLLIEGVFDPRGEFDGASGFRAPADARYCYLSMHLCATIVSSAPRSEIERLHERVLGQNMVLGALRGIPRTSELIVRPSGSVVANGIQEASAEVSSQVTTEASEARRTLT
jgi:hypothetical protein